MKKLIKIEFDNTTKERKTEDSFSELYSYDKNNGLFEFEILNDTLTTEQVTALFKFTESNKVWKTTGTVEGNKANVTFDTTLITQNETVICYLYFDEEQRTSDTFRFKFKVKVSEIDKMSRYEVKERFINNTVIVDRLDVVTKEELKEALKNVGGIATEGLLTETKAEETYAKKSEAVDNTNFELVKNRVLALELKTDKDTIYDDTNVRERLTALESKPNIDLSTLATKEELEAIHGSQPSIDNLVTKDELASKNYLTEHQNLDEYAKKSEIPQEYNDSEVKERLTNLENKAPVDLSNVATKQELNEVRNSQPTVDTSNLVTRDELTAKNYLTEHQSLENLVTKQELEDKHYLTQHQSLDNLVTKEELNSKGYLTQHQNISHLVTNDELNSKGYLTEEVLNSKNYLTEDVLNTKNYLTQHQDLSNLVTKQELENKHYLTEHQPLTHLATTSDLEALRNVSISKSELSKKVDATEYNTFKDIVVTKDELNSKGYLTEHQDISNLATKQEVEDTYAKKSELPAPYNDSALVNRINVLETKQDNDTVYNDEPIKERLTALESRSSSQSEMRGTGMPNGVVDAPIGATYIDTAKTNGALKWIKTTDGGNTGWKVSEGDTGWVLGWQADMGNNKNRMYFRRKNDVVHVKFNPEINTSTISPDVNLILAIGGYEEYDNLSIDGFKPVDDVVQTIFKTSSDIYSETASMDNSEGAQRTGAVIIQYKYYRYKDYAEKSALKLQIVTSELGVEQNHVNPFSYLTEDEWPTELPTI